MEEERVPEALYEETQELILPLKALGMAAGAGGGLALASTVGWVARLGVAGLAAAGVGLLVGEFLVPMRTTLLPDELQIRFGRRTRFRIPLKNVVSAYPRTYHPLREYGGWGIRRGFQGRAFNMRGDQGVQLVLRSGQRVLVGSQTPEELADAIRKAAGCGSDPDAPGR